MEKRHYVTPNDNEVEVLRKVTEKNRNVGTEMVPKHEELWKAFSMAVFFQDVQCLPFPFIHTCWFYLD